MKYSDDYAKRCERLIGVSLSINQTYKVLMKLIDLQNNHCDVFNLSVTFYRSVIRNCIMTIFVEVSKLFSEDKKSEGTRSLLLKLQSDLKDSTKQTNDMLAFEINQFASLTDDSPKVIRYNCLKDFIKKSLDEIDQYQNIIEQIRIQRNKIYAHYDLLSEQEKTDLLKENKVTFEEMNNLLVLNMNICDGLYKYYYDITMMPLFAGYDDLDSTVSYVEKGLKDKQTRK